MFNFSLFLQIPIYLQNVVSLVVSDHAPCTPDLKDTSKVRQNKSLDVPSVAPEYERTTVRQNFEHTLPFKMFGPFWSVWCKMALAEVGVSLP